MATAIDRKNAADAKKKARKEKFRASPFGKWLDSCFYQNVTIDLSEAQDGSDMKTIRKPRPTKAILIAVLFLTVVGISFIPFKFGPVKWQWGTFGNSFATLFTPNANRTVDSAGWWSFAWTSFAIGINSALANSSPFLTIFEICFLGTTIGAVLAIPIYYLCANNVNHNTPSRLIVKIFNDFLRCIPMFILCVFFSMIMGIGNILPAVVAISIFSLGIMYQMMYEYIETLNMQPFESIRSAGANNLQAVNLSLHPEIKPMFFAYFIYTLEINIRGAVVLSYAGVSGTYMSALQAYIENGWYDYVGAMLFPLFIVVAILQLVSNSMVRKLR